MRWLQLLFAFLEHWIPMICAWCRLNFKNVWKLFQHTSVFSFFVLSRSAALPLRLQALPSSHILIVLKISKFDFYFPQWMRILLYKPIKRRCQSLRTRYDLWISLKEAKKKRNYESMHSIIELWSYWFHIFHSLAFAKKFFSHVSGKRNKKKT